MEKRKLSKYKYPKKTKSFVANYSEEVKSTLTKLAEIYRTNSNTNLHGFIINCIKTGTMIRVDEDSLEKQIRFQRIRNGLQSNLSQAEDLIEYIKNNQTLIPALAAKISIQNKPYAPEIILKNLHKQLVDITHPIIYMEITKVPDSVDEYFEIKNSIPYIDRKSKVNRKKERGTIKEKRVKLELDQKSQEILAEKAAHFLNYGSYKNEEDQLLERPNKTAALLQIIYESEQLVTGYKITDQELDYLEASTMKFNEKIKEFNTAVKAAVGFKPADLFDVLQTLYREINLLNIK